MNRAIKWTLIPIGALLFLLLLAFALLWFFVATERGLKTAAGQIAERVPGLEIGTVGGTLQSGLNNDTLSFSNESIRVEARGLDSSWRSACLLKKTFCLDSLTLDELSIEPLASTASETDAPATAAELPSVTVPLGIDLKNVTIKTLRIKLADGTEQTLRDVTLSARNDGSTLLIDQLSTQWQNIEAALSGRIQLDGDYPLDLTLQASASKLLDEHDLDVQLRLTNSLTDLEFDAVLSNMIDVHLAGKANPLDPQLPASLRATAAELQWPLATEAPDFVGRALDVSVDGTMADYTLSLSTDVDGTQIPASSIKLSGQVNTERLLLPDVTVLTLGGFATGLAAVSWADRVTWLTDMVLKDINPGSHLPDVDGRLDGQLTASGNVADGLWTLDVTRADVFGELRQFPIQLQTAFDKNASDIWTLHTLKLDNDQNTLTASGQVGDTWSLKADASMPQLQNLLPDLAGGFDATLDVSGALLEPDITVSAQSRLVKFNDVLLRGLKLDSSIQRAALENSSLKLRVGSVNMGAEQFLNTRLDLDGTRTAHQIQLFTDGPQKTSIDLAATGGLSDTFDWLGTLKSVALEVPAHNITLQAPTALEWRQQSKKFSVDPHCWLSADSKLCLENKVLAEAEGSAIVSLDQYAMERLNLFLPANSELKGTLRADSTIQWGKNQPGGFSAVLNAGIDEGGVRVLQERGPPLNFGYDSLTLNTEVNATRLDTRLTLSSTSMGKANVVFGMDPATEEKPIDGSVQLNGFNVGFLQAFLPQFETVAGTLNVNGDISGSLVDPRFNGDVVLDSPRVAAELLPLSIDGGKLVANVRGKRSTISGSLNSGSGAIDVTGRANWQTASWRADIGLVGEDLSVVQNPLVASSVFPDVKINARPGFVQIAGNVSVPSARINIRELPRGATTLSDDVIIIEDIVETPETAGEGTSADASATDIKVKLNVELGDDVRLSGYGLTARLEGDMSVSIDNPNPPQLGGSIQVEDGIYKQYGQDLAASGEILFFGPVDQTRLDIDAVREIAGETRTAGLRLQGPLAEPEVTLFTEPADKTEESILSYIVLGRDISEASDSESSLLASAALALALKGSRGAATNLAEDLGIQEFTLDARGNGDDTEVVVSGRLNDRLLLRYGRSVFDSQNTLYLRYDITKQLYLEAARGLQRAVDLFYSFSF